jgi:homocysteine S-methyltransferase
MNLKELIHNSPFIMTEGAVVEKLRRKFKVELDPYVVLSGFIYKPDKRLCSIYKQYIEIVHKRDLPMLIFTPTRRANPER